MSDDERLQVSTGDWKEKVTFFERAFLYEVLRFLNWSILLIVKTDFEKIGKKNETKRLAYSEDSASNNFRGIEKYLFWDFGVIAIPKKVISSNFIWHATFANFFF